MSHGWTVPASSALRARALGPIASFDPESTPGFDGDKDSGTELLAERGRALADLQELLFANGRSGITARCCWCCRRTRGKAASSATSAVLSIHRACPSRDSGNRPRRSCSTTSCGASTRPYPLPDGSASSTARTTRTCCPCGFTTWFRDRSGRSATTSSTSSSPNSSRAARPSSSAASWCRRTNRRSASPSVSIARTSAGSTTPATSTSAPTGMISRGVPGDLRPHRPRRRSLVRHPGQPEVVLAPGGVRAVDRRTLGPRTRLAEGRFRRGVGEEAAGGRGLTIASAAPRTPAVPPPVPRRRRRCRRR